MEQSQDGSSNPRLKSKQQWEIELRTKEKEAVVRATDALRREVETLKRRDAFLCRLVGLLVASQGGKILLCADIMSEQWDFRVEVHSGDGAVTIIAE